MIEIEMNPAVRERQWPPGGGFVLGGRVCDDAFPGIEPPP